MAYKEGFWNWSCAPVTKSIQRRRADIAPLTNPFGNSKLHTRATMLLKIKGDFMEATMSLKTIRLN